MQRSRSTIWAWLVLALCGVLSPCAWGQWVTAPVTAPRVQYRTFASAAAGTTVSFHVFTPPAYDNQPQRRFPVLYWLHGSGSPTGGIAPMSNWFGTAMAQGNIPPMIVVFPNGMPYSMWCNSKDGTVPMESVIIQDLIPHVDATFRTIASREGRIIEGFSMGGYGAGRLGFKYPQLFAGISMLGAGPVQLDFLAPDPGTTVPEELRLTIYEQVWGSDPAYFLAQSPWMLAQQNAQAIIAQRVRVRQAIGTADALFPSNVSLRDHILLLGIPLQFTAVAGVGHSTLPLLQGLGVANWEFYRRALQPCDSLDYNQDGDFPTPLDLEDFVAAVGGNICSTCSTDLDFNNDGDFPTPLDIEAFISVSAGGPCV